MRRFLSIVLVSLVLLPVCASVTVTDQVGRKVVIENNPERIVSGYYISSSACIAMGLEDNLVAVEAQAEKRPIYRLAAPQLISGPNVGTAKAFNLEVCLAVDPDLVILPMKQKETAVALEKMGIAAIVVNPESHEEIVEMFSLIGKATGHVKEANTLIVKYKAILKNVEKKTALLTKKPVVYMCGASDYLTTVSNDMYQAKLIEMAGGINAGKDIDGASKKQIGYEQFLAMNPDVIIVPTNSNANGTPDYSVNDIMSDPLLQDVKAVKNGAVYQMPVGLEAWDSPVPSGALGVLWMLNTLHPELYSSNELEKQVNSFYRDLYGFDPKFSK